MASRSSIERDRQPLLDNEDEPDSRFAIDEDTIFDADQENSTSATSNHNKYPPLPPSYNDATTPSTFWTRHPEITEHFNHFTSRTGEWLGSFPTPFSVWNSTKSKCYSIGCWPTNRMTQVGVFLFFLWVLVIVTGPSFEMNEGDGARKGGGGKNLWGEDLSVSPPNPVSGDGHIVKPAEWEMPTCRTQRISFSKRSGSLLKRLWGPPRRVVCHTKTSFSLRVPASFEGTEAVFFYADPERTHSKDRGSTSGHVEIQVDESLPREVPKEAEDDHHARSHHGHSHTKIMVDVKANYEHDAQFLLDGTTVAKMGANLWDEGVGIYSWPLPPPWSLRAHDDPPLWFDVTIRIPPGSAVPALRTEVAAMSINCFTSEAKSSRSLPEARAAEAPYFGRFKAASTRGGIVSSSIRSVSYVRLSASNGDVNIQPGSSLWGPGVRLHSHNGDILLGDDSTIEARGEGSLKTSNGNILLGKNTKISAVKLEGASNNGQITSLDRRLALEDPAFGIWFANHTLDLRSDNGNVRAKVAVVAPDISKLPPGPEHRYWVKVDAVSSNGDVQLLYDQHQKGTPLSSRAEAKAAGKISVKHHQEYEGTWEVKGWKGSKVEKPTLKSDGGRSRRFDIKGNDKGHQTGGGEQTIKGEIGWDPSSTKVGKDQDGLLPDGGSSIATSAGGVVEMSFA